MGDRWRFVRSVLVAVAAIAAASCLAGVGQALAVSPSSSPATGKVILRLGWTISPDNLNPFIGYAGSSYEVWSLQYDQLFLKYPDGTFGPSLAAEIPTKANGGISVDGKVWTVKIRPGVKWSDGRPLTAADVAFSYNYIVGNPTSVLFSAVKGISHVEALDSTRVRVVCTYPKADMLFVWVPILPEHIWGAIKPSVVNTSYANRPPIVGSGPFLVTEFKKGVYVKMERNADYWGAAPAVDEIIFQAYSDGETMTQDVKIGVLDGAQGIPVALYKTMQGDPRLQAVAANFLNLDHVYFNCKEGPSKGNPVLRDAEFRRALAFAIDEQKLVDVVHAGLGEPGTSVIPPKTFSDPDWHWEPAGDAALSFDLQKAQQMLDAAGYGDTNGDGLRENHGKPIRLRLWARADSTTTQGEAKLIAGWWTSLGIDVTFSVLDIGAIDDRFWNFEGATYVPDFDAIVDVGSVYMDPGQTLDLWRTSQIGNWNMPCWSNAEYDRLWEVQARTIDLEKRKNVVWRMQQILYEDAADVILAYPQSTEVFDVQDWQGWVPLPVAAGAPSWVFGLSYNVETYLDLKPVSGSEAGDGTSWPLPAAGAVVAAALVAGIWYTMRRRAGRAAREEEE